MGPWYGGSWSEWFLCKPWSYSVRVELRVRDAYGNYSPIATRTCGNTASDL